MESGAAADLTITTETDGGTITIADLSDLTFNKTANDDGTFTWKAELTGDDKEHQIAIQGFNGKVTWDLGGAGKTDQDDTGSIGGSSTGSEETEDTGDAADAAEPETTEAEE